MLLKLDRELNEYYKENIEKHETADNIIEIKKH